MSPGDNQAFPDARVVLATFEGEVHPRQDVRVRAWAYSARNLRVGLIV